MRIRSALSGEAESLSQLAFAAKSVWPYPKAALERYRDQLRVHESDVTAGLVFVAEAAGETVGFYALSPASDPYRLYFMFIGPEFQRRGYGRELWSDALERARRLNWPHLRFFADDFASTAFYFRLGCRKLRMIENDLSGLVNELEIDLAEVQIP